MSIIMRMEITWGDTIQVTGDAPLKYRPGQFAAVCGVRETSKGEAVTAELIFTIEFGDGSSIDIPSELVEKVVD